MGHRPLDGYIILFWLFTYNYVRLSFDSLGASRTFKNFGGQSCIHPIAGSSRSCYFGEPYTTQIRAVKELNE